MPFSFTPTAIADVVLVEPRVFPDGRGSFLETYKRSDFIAAGIDVGFQQDNHSVSDAGVLRGLHYQLPPHAQAKLVRVVRGAVWDVAVDIRRGSPTFGQWVGHELSEDNHLMLYIPSGFAHGFLVLRDNTHFVYKCSAEYHRDSEAGLRWDDTDVAIEWPFDALPGATRVGTAGRDAVTVSQKDASLPPLRDARVFA